MACTLHYRGIITHFKTCCVIYYRHSVQVLAPISLCYFQDDPKPLRDFHAEASMIGVRVVVDETSSGAPAKIDELKPHSEDM